MKIIKYYIFKFLLISKRFLYIIFLNFQFFKSSLKWLINSNEHTSFSLDLSEKNKTMLILQLSNNLNIDIKVIKDIFDKSEEIDFNEFHKKRSLNFVDVDFSSKFDYRLICLLIVLKKNIKNIIELGFNQGRIPYLLNKFSESYDFEFKYFGIDYNERKGAFINKNTDNTKLIYGKVEDQLQNLSSVLDNESILVSTTHTLDSEKFVFDYLIKNNILPKYIVSDNISNESSFKNFLNLSNQYELDIYCFEDSGRFLNSLYIGLAIKR